MAASSPNEPPAGLRSLRERTGGSAWVNRLYEARYLLIVATAALFATSAAWDAPVLFTGGAVALLIFLAAVLPRRPVERRAAAVAAGARDAGAELSIFAVVDALPEAAFLLDSGEVVRHANRRAAELFPATRAGDPFTFTFRSPEIAAALQEAQAGQAGMVEFREPGERTSFYSVWLRPVALPGTIAPLVLAIVEDLSDRLALARMRSDFVANASHELRTPLASLTGFIETLLGPARNDREATEKFLKIMLDQARRMRRLLDNLLSLSRAETRLHQRPTDRVELGGVLEHVRDALAPLAREQGVQLGVKGPGHPVEILGDRDELVQVFQNLIENGIRYGASGGRVEVRLEAPDGERGTVAVQVQDYGPGIAPEHLPRLTERFYRIDVGASGEMKGTGLGLAIVKHILTRHRGRLSVMSRPGEGATFTVELPYPH